MNGVLKHLSVIEYLVLGAVKSLHMYTDTTFKEILEKQSKIGIYLEAKTMGLNRNVLMAREYHAMQVDRVEVLIHNRFS